MKKIVHKWFVDFGKEEKWLNEMAAKGLCITGIGFWRYEFEDCQPGEYAIRMELLKDFPTHPESQKYISFMEETGAEHITSYNKWVYFRKKIADGPFDLFSDNSSRIQHLNRILIMIGLICLANLIIGFSNIFTAIAWGSNFNYLGFINIALSIFFISVYYKYYKQKKNMEKEQNILKDKTKSLVTY